VWCRTCRSTASRGCSRPRAGRCSPWRGAGRSRPSSSAPEAPTCAAGSSRCPTRSTSGCCAPTRPSCPTASSATTPARS
jgi:hypothetical protein